MTIDPLEMFHFGPLTKDSATWQQQQAGSFLKQKQVTYTSFVQISIKFWYVW